MKVDEDSFGGGVNGSIPALRTLRCIYPVTKGSGEASVAIGKTIQELVPCVPCSGSRRRLVGPFEKGDAVTGEIAVHI